MKSTDIDLSMYPRWNDACIWKRTEDGLIIFQITEQPGGAQTAPSHTVCNITLNREGRDAWSLCTGEHTVASIVDTLQKEYLGDPSFIQRDITEMIARLAEENYLLLEKSPHPADRNLDEKAFLKRSDHVIANVVEDHFIVMNLLSSEVHSFDRGVEYIWNICDSTHTAGDILAAAANKEETQFLLHFLVRLGMIELV